MSVIENNILIAEFMGATITDFVGMQKPIYSPIMGASYFSHKLKYNSSWDWLMPVVEKIESFQGQYIGCGVSIHQNYVLIGYTSKDKNFEYSKKGKIKIEAVYSAVIEFIRWYNETNKQ